ncbi:hypothetical protein P691DRAFT_738881 [Macrolepiota fuliginosa MF-IS2]|uniref:AB hydrolase-1 domain-containing protein n=1 Tax=Macrolepiota fuliginosa MF-IS2 TaxID=1400762 RepID=A0A9P5X1G7_9AGAR|nr:hypothetical protein P691DRAFT_738881 [Macrolepiota fuliginosa MF-IS2]
MSFRWSLRKLWAVFTVLSLVVLCSSTNNFYWIDIEPTHDLVWHSCYQPLHRECARLLVPLNHLNQSSRDHGRASIALIRKPSRFSSGSSTLHSRYRGPILFNPGGPGGSGISLINQYGDLLAQVLGDEFDIVGFDPRGVGRSTPKVNFFGSAASGEKELWGYEGLYVIRDKGVSVENIWARAVVRNKISLENKGEWLGNVNTEQAAYDMLSITKAFGREKLMYWGFSYGTILGATFAALFPDKVERVVLDGVVDAEDYYATSWTTNLLNTTATLDQFFMTCHAAGSSSCAFWAPSPSLISANLTRIYKDLIVNPIPIHTSTSYGVLDYSRLRITIFMALYSPWASWPLLAQALADLGGPNRDPKRIWQMSATPTFGCPSCSLSCDDKDRREREFGVDNFLDALTAILCSDGLDTPADVAAAKKYFETFTSVSEWADVWGSIRLSCAGWPKVKKGFQGPVEGRTGFPILFVGNTADPVTPLASAKRMSKRFPGSRVLTQDSPGHASISAPSVCTQSHVRRYFLNGTLPPEGTVCPVISAPFPSDSSHRFELGGVPKASGDVMEVVFKSEGTSREQGLWDAVDRLSKAWNFPFNPTFL